MYSSHSVYGGYTISTSASRLSVETTNGETRLKDFMLIGFSSEQPLPFKCVHPRIANR